MFQNEKGVNVQVLLRCRPFSEDEVRSNALQVVSCNEYQRKVAVSQNIAGKHIDRVFTFDKVFGPDAQQQDLYDQAVIPIVKEVLEGFNCTIFAYGQTGTGKTYTMVGDCKRSKGVASGELPPGAGVIPRAVKQIFDTLESQKAEYSVKVTFLELYNEEITDLLAPQDLSRVSLEDKKKQLPLMEDGKGGVLVRGLVEEVVTSASEILNLIERGSAKRRTAETLLNKQSSRSHSLFSITIHTKEATPEGEELIKCSKLNLVDLAGSENISRSGAREGRLREAGEINKSLLTLGRVISALVEHLGHVPYRDSKLTRLLRDSLGGRTKTCMIATVSPDVHCLEETLSTLDYAHRAKHIKNKPEKIEELQAKYDAQVEQCVNLTKSVEETLTDMNQTNKLLADTENELKHCQYSLKERDFIISEQKKAENALTHQACALRDDLEKIQKDNASLFLKLAKEDRLNADNSSIVNNFQADLKHHLGLLSQVLVGSMSEQHGHLKLVMNTCNSFLEVHDKAACELKKRVSASKVLCISHFEALQNVVRLHKAGSNAALDELLALTSSNSKSVEDLLASEAVRVKSIFDEIQETFCINQVEMAHLATELRQRFTGSIGHMLKTSASLRYFIERLSTKSKQLQNHAVEIDEAQTKCISGFQKAYKEQSRSDAEKLIADMTSLVSNCMRHQREMVDARFCGLKGSDDRNHVLEIDEAQTKCISGFQKAYEEQSRSDAEKLIADMTSLVSNCMRRQREMVDARLCGLKGSVDENKMFLDEHISAMNFIATGLKNNWHDYFTQTESYIKDLADFSATKHCRMESLLQKCLSTADTALNHFQRTHQSLNEISNQHAATIASHVREMTANNEQQDIEIELMRVTFEGGAQRSTEDIIGCFCGLSEQERQSVSEIQTTNAHLETIIKHLKKGYSQHAASIEKLADVTFKQKYMEYKPTGSTPTKCEPHIPSKSSIESLRSMPVEALQEEFRENNTYDSFSREGNTNFDR